MILIKIMSIALIVYGILVIFERVIISRTPGLSAELKTCKALNLNLSADEYFIYHDVYIPINGDATQIDLLVFSRYGVFVIEVKNYRGVIYGHEFGEEWTQVIHRRKYHFQNPLRQNYKHMKAVADYFNISEDSIYPIVFFTGNAFLKTKMPSNVLYYSKLGGYSYLIKYILQKETLQFTGQEYNRIYSDITKLFHNKHKHKAQHQKFIDTRGYEHKTHQKTIKQDDNYSEDEKNKGAYI